MYCGGRAADGARGVITQLGGPKHAIVGRADVPFSVTTLALLD